MSVLAFTMTMHAQEKVKFNVYLATNLSTFTGDVEDVSMLVGYSVGAGISYDISEKWTLKPSLNFTRKGGKSEGFINQYPATETVKPFYIEMPIDLCYKIPLNKDMKLNLIAGTYLAYGVSGKLKFEVESGGMVLTEEQDFFGSTRAKRFDAGLEIGAGLELSELTFLLKTQLGIANIGRNGDMRNQTLSLGVAYTF